MIATKAESEADADVWQKPSPRTFNEALNEVECPRCGAKPGENCDADKPMPAGKTKAVHTARLYA